ncbi:hypothetical protein [Mycobacterium botniense]|uniref:Phage tail tape measure protein n=1 Tax=Mycobacterium botniense TaxID=84962 RepID=A0A7I9XY97_9MYCO|nr:hypothetical protein [Mycobacterium botniense]GFG74717.1 hypothetical protein MBOT_20820 [Mycobacterium botniense]
MGQVEVAQKRLNETTAKYGADSSKAAAANVALADSHARASKAQRDHVDAMVAAEAAHSRLGSAMDKSATSASRAGQVFNAIGVASVAGLGVAFVETTKKAGDFQQAMMKLHASAGLPAQDLKTASDGILKLAGQVGYTGELAEGMYTITGRIPAADGFKVLQAAAQGANAEQAPPRGRQRADDVASGLPHPGRPGGESHVAAGDRGRRIQGSLAGIRGRATHD